MQIRQTFAPLLAAAVAAVALWSGIAPTDRAGWWAEGMLALIHILTCRASTLCRSRWSADP